MADNSFKAPQPFPLQQHERSWKQSLRSYEPIEYTSSDVLDEWGERKHGGWADPPDPESIVFEHSSRLTFNPDANSYEPVEISGVSVDDASDRLIGRPINHYQRTGFQGRGKLGKWGVNRTSYLLFFRVDAVGNKQVLLRLSLRKNEFMLPGGFLLDSENSLKAAKRCFLDACASSDMETIDPDSYQRELDEVKVWLDDIVAGVDEDDVVSRGYLEDAKNTDNAWIEGTVFMVDLPTRAWSTTDPIDALETSKLAWVDYDEIAEGSCAISLNESHRDIIMKADAEQTEEEYWGVIGFAVLIWIVLVIAMNSNLKPGAVNVPPAIIFDLDH